MQTSLTTRKLIESIQAGCFQNLWCNGIVKTNPYVELQLSIFKQVYEKETNGKPESRTQSRTLYRSLFNIPIQEGDRIHQPYPVSTTLSSEFARDWLFGNVKHKTILVMQTSEGLVVDTDEEREVVLPPGYIQVDRLMHYDRDEDISYYTCRFIY